MVEPAEVPAAKITGVQLAVSLHPSDLQILTAVNDFTSGWLWLLYSMRLVQIRTCEFQLYVYAGSSLDASMQSLPEEEPLISEDNWPVAEYADDIHKHLRESEVSIYTLKLVNILSHLCFLDLSALSSS